MAEMDGTIVCEACGFENSGRTQYCQDCGARLNRPEADTVFTPPPAAPPAGLTPPRVPPPPVETPFAAPSPSLKPKPAPRRRRIHIPVLSIFGAILRTLFYAALVAVLIQIMRQPADMPPPIQAFPPETVQQLRALMQEKSSTGGNLPISWQNLNHYLTAVLAPADEGQSVSFSRAALAPAEDGGFSLYASRNIFGLNFCTTVYYKPVNRGGGLGVTATGAAVGRVPLPAWTAGLVETSLGGLDTALYLELDTLGKAQSVDIGENEAVLHFPTP